MLTTTILVTAACVTGIQGAHLGLDYGATNLKSNEQNFASIFQSKRNDFSCECKNRICACCTQVREPKLAMNNTACVVTEAGILNYFNMFALHWDEETVFTTMGLDMFKDGLKMCAGVPGKPEAEVCIHLSNNDDLTKICINLQVSHLTAPLVDVRVGCIESSIPEEVKALLKLQDRNTPQITQNFHKMHRENSGVVKPYFI